MHARPLDELGEIAARQGSDVLTAMSLHARGAVALAEGDALTALAALRRASLAWQELEAPYEEARVRELVGLACRVLADEDAAALELGAAREILAQLGAAADVARIDSLGSDASKGGTHGLTDRELEVLRLVAAGKSNHAIAVALHLSDHTIRRHLQNIFRKLNVSSRAAATAFAFRNGLI